ncbi:MAG: mechanosensitive ion channel domain-containing protein, partial [Planctomycetia bacterium]
GFRSTKLRTPEDSILILPNGSLANGIIDNYGLRKLRRIRLLFGLDLLTPVEKIHILQEKVTSFVNNIPSVEPGRNSVMFLKVGELGLEFEIIGYAHVHDNDAERALKESILEATLRLCKELEIKPTNLKK